MNVYLIASESYKLLNEELKKIVPQDGNIIKYDLRISTLEDVINEAGYFSLLNEMKYIIVKAGDLFKPSKKEDSSVPSKDTKLLENYLKNPALNSKIIFTSYEMPDKRKKIFKVINENKNYIEVPTLNKKDLTYKCIDLLKQKGYRISYDLASFIVDNSYVNYDILLNELEKIYVLVKPKNLEKEDIKDIISLSVSNKTYTYISAIVKGDLKSALEASSTFEKMKIDPIVVLISLAKEMQIYLNIKEGISPKDIQRLYLKEDWMMKGYMQNADSYTVKELKKIITILNNYDYGLKCGTLDKSVALDLLALELCA